MLPRYDGMVRVKMQAFKEMDNTDLAGIADILVDWGDQINPPAPNFIRIQDCPEWVRYSDLYRFFRV